MKTVHILKSVSSAPVPLPMLTDFQTLIITFSVKNNARSPACQLVEDLYLIPWLFSYYIKSVSDENKMADRDQG